VVSGQSVNGIVQMCARNQNYLLTIACIWAG
jgi:hypothetical protein